MLSLHFSYTQRLIPSAKHINSVPCDSEYLDARVYALFASIFFLVDSTLHFLAGTYKGCIGTTILVLGKNSSKYYKEAQHHFTQALRYLPFIAIGSPLGLIHPNVFQSKNLQEYLRWKSKSFCNQASQSDNDNHKTMQITNDALQRQEPSLFDSTCAGIEEDNSSTASEEYYETYEVIQSEKEQNMQKEISKLHDLLTREQEKGSTLDLLLSSLKHRHPYNQILLIQRFTEKYPLNAPAIFEYSSNAIKEEINAEFIKELKMSFCEFCRSANPKVQSASEIFKKMLNKNTFMSFTNPAEAFISKAINFIQLI